MKKLLLLAFFYVLTFVSRANIAMPGFFNVGTGAGFVPYFREDAVHFGKIQMKSEVITIQLYRGYAVVKGEYLMYNHDKQKIDMKIGYPINGTIYSNDFNAISFQDLYEFTAVINGEKTKNFLFKTDTINESHRPRHLKDIRKWYVWQASFEPEKITKVTVYFIVNTSQGFIRKGYDKGETDGFCYVLESGAAWKDKIEKGRIFIELKDNLSQKDILATFPNKIFKIQNQQMIFDFKDLEPKPADNIIIRLNNTKNIDDENFKKITKNVEKLLADIDAIDAENITLKNSTIIDANNTKINTSINSLTSNFLTFLAVYGLPLFMVFIGVMVAFNAIFRKKLK